MTSTCVNVGGKSEKRHCERVRPSTQHRGSMWDLADAEA